MINDKVTWNISSLLEEFVQGNSNLSLVFSFVGIFKTSDSIFKSGSRTIASTLLQPLLLSFSSFLHFPIGSSGLHHGHLGSLPILTAPLLPSVLLLLLSQLFGESVIFLPSKNLPPRVSSVRHDTYGCIELS